MADVVTGAHFIVRKERTAVLHELSHWRGEIRHFRRHRRHTSINIAIRGMLELRWILSLIHELALEKTQWFWVWGDPLEAFKTPFDADVPAGSIDVYLEVDARPQPEPADREAVARIEPFVRRHADHFVQFLAATDLSIILMCLSALLERRRHPKD